MGRQLKERAKPGNNRGMPISDASPITPRHRDLLTVVETMNCGLLASDTAAFVMYANPRLLGWLRYTWDEVIGEPTVNLGAPEHATQHLDEMRAIHEGDLRVRMVVLRRKDTTTFPALAIPQRLFDEDGNLEGTFSIIVDLGSVQTAKRIGIEDAPGDVASALEEIAKQLEALQASSGASAPLLDPRHASLTELSRREFEILEHLMVGERVSVIATNLFISEHTVRNHLKSIFRKTGTGSQAELIGWARELD